MLCWWVLRVDVYRQRPGPGVRCVDHLGVGARNCSSRPSGARPWSLDLSAQNDVVNAVEDPSGPRRARDVNACASAGNAADGTSEHSEVVLGRWRSNRSGEPITPFGEGGHVT
jgi:hypothetical protein